MHIVSLGDNFLEFQILFSRKNKKKMLFAEIFTKHAKC